jgi:hypothetical protein
MVAEVVEEQTMNPVLGGSNRPSDTPKKPYKIAFSPFWAVFGRAFSMLRMSRIFS